MVNMMGMCCTRVQCTFLRYRNCVVMKCTNVRPPNHSVVYDYNSITPMVIRPSANSKNQRSSSSYTAIRNITTLCPAKRSLKKMQGYKIWQSFHRRGTTIIYDQNSWETVLYSGLTYRSCDPSILDGNMFYLLRCKTGPVLSITGYQEDFECDALLYWQVV